MGECHREIFEYKTITDVPKGFWGGAVDVGQFEHELNLPGNDGGELVSGISTTQSYGSSKCIVCIFKRRKA